MKICPGEFIRFRLPTEVRMGLNIREKTVDFINEFNVRKITLVYDVRLIEDNQNIKKIVNSLNNNFEVQLISGPEKEPELTLLEKIREDASQHDPEAVIGLGGGSTIDLAKGLAAILPNSKPAADYQGFDKLENPGLPFISIPTIFGAGTEVTASAVMINREKNSKGGINGKFVFPKMAIIDPELALSAPSGLIGATGLDALVHCIEGYVAKCSTPFSKICSKEGAHRIIPALQTLAADKKSINAMEQLAFGSFLAIMGLMHSESGVCGAISYPLGVYYGVPHGLAGGLCMPGAIRWNCDNGCSAYNELLPDNIDKNENGGYILAETIEELIERFNLKKLKAFGLDYTACKDMADIIINFNAVLEMNPIKIDNPEIISKLIKLAL